MIEVFKTSIQQDKAAQKVAKEILRYNPKAKISFDLKDQDKIMRIESENIDCTLIIKLFNDLNINCETLL